MVQTLINFLFAIAFDSKGNDNSPANEFWELTLAYTPINALDKNYTYITFLRNGSIDWTQTAASDFDYANTLLAPAISSLPLQAGVKFDFWELTNWLFVSYYWIALADLGQISPVTVTNYPVQTLLPSTNNIFINQTIFDIYASYLRNTVAPLLNISAHGWTPQDFDPLNSTNRLQAIDMEFIRSYQCLERHLKAPISFVISLIVADHVLIMLPYSLIIWVAAAMQKH